MDVQVCDQDEPADDGLVPNAGFARTRAGNAITTITPGNISNVGNVGDTNTVRQPVGRCAIRTVTAYRPPARHADHRGSDQHGQPDSILPHGKSYTFWGRGVSQGHSDAIRRIDGVLDARQYTVPKEQYLEAIRNGETPDVDGYKGHLRECYVVAAPDADKAKIENEIKTMENYFVGYETVVNFISQEELDRDHKGIPHGGFVLRSGESTDGTRHVVEYSLKLDSNPEFTGSALVAYARGIYRLAKHGGTGCYTVFDIPPAWISTHSAEELRAHSL